MTDSIDQNAIERVTVAWDLDKAKNKGELWQYIKKQKSPKPFKDFIYDKLKQKIPTSDEFTFIKSILKGNRQILKMDRIQTFKWRGFDAVALRGEKGRFKTWGIMPKKDKTTSK